MKRSLTVVLSTAVLALGLTACGDDKPLTGDALCRSKSFEQLATTTGCADYLARYSSDGSDCDEGDFREKDTDCGFPEQKKAKKTKKPKARTSSR